jgi:hypothetical protein
LYDKDSGYSAPITDANGKLAADADREQLAIAKSSDADQLRVAANSDADQLAAAVANRSVEAPIGKPI